MTALVESGVAAEAPGEAGTEGTGAGQREATRVVPAEAPDPARPVGPPETGDKAPGKARMVVATATLSSVIRVSGSVAAFEVATETAGGTLG